MMKGGITMMNNFFNELEAKMAAWIEKRNTHESIKEIVAKENGWDSEAMNAWKAEMEEIKAEQPYTQGECKAFRVWKYGGGTDTDIILDDYVWDDEVHDIPYEDITQISYGDNYSKMYYKYVTMQ